MSKHIFELISACAWPAHTSLDAIASIRRLSSVPIVLSLPLPLLPFFLPFTSGLGTLVWRCGWRFGLLQFGFDL